MKKYLLSFFLIFLITQINLNSKIIKAQEIKESQRWVCLKAERIESHTAEISVDPNNKLIPNTETYIFECLANNQNLGEEICTTGDKNLDMKVFNQPNLEIIQSKIKYQFDKNNTTLRSNPIKSDINGNIPPFKWTSHTPEINLGRRFLALNYFIDNINKGVEGDKKSQQISTFSFDEAINSSDCVTISWDPYGRVFDAKTLEPISQIKVYLLIKKGNDFKIMTPSDLLGGNIINPQTTLEDGYFNFVVPDGDYKLIINSENYKYPVNINEINKNYKNIYSDIYPSETGEIIIQRGKIQHRDIPLYPTKESQNNNPKLMEYFYNLDKKRSNLIIKGRVSHPFSLIMPYSLKINENGLTQRNKPLLENPIKTDKYGNFEIRISQLSFEENEFFGDLLIEKTILNQVIQNKKNKIFTILSKIPIIKNIYAENIKTAVRFNPILNNIEGYAYDENNQVIPFAEVYINLNFSKNPYYKTNADEKGYFKIESKFLPSMPYTIIFKDPISKKQIKINSIKFITQNKNNLLKNRINLNKYIAFEGKKDNNIDNNTENNNQNIKDIKFNNNENYFKKENNNLLPKNNQKITTNNKISQIFIILIILFILILSVFLLLYSYLKNRKN